MSRIKTTFEQLKKTQTKAFIPFIMAGDGGLENTLLLMQTLVENGADILELGVAFSDPMADGPVISRAHQRAVEAGVSLATVLELVQKFRQNDDKTPVLLMGYLNPIEVFGYQKFADKASSSGVDGVLVVDMPPEESEDLKQNLDAVSIDFIFLIAPTTTDNRIALLSKIASGFVYFVALKGVTGAANLDVDLVKRNLKCIHQHIDLPVGVGFGIQDSASAKRVSEYADAVIVGSALVIIVEKYLLDKTKMLATVGALAAEISEAIK
ncbi:MAG: tryptophan synthase subunit alpha [Candidatus Thioglobus sp.]|nr:tryptophan synthase subunit alpha [Candidatus Thioglobus sp.]